MLKINKLLKINNRKYSRPSVSLFAAAMYLAENEVFKCLLH